MLVKNERSFALIQKINAKKAPLEAAKLEASNDLQALMLEFAAKEKAIRDHLVKLNEQLAPLDILASEVAKAGAMKRESSRKMLLDDLETRI